MNEINQLIHNWSFALFDLACELNKIKKMADDVSAIEKVLKQNKEYLNILDSFNINSKTKMNLIDEAFGKFDEKIVIFIKLVSEAHIAKLLLIILNKFLELCNNKMNVKYGHIYTTIALTNKQIEAFEKKLSKQLSSEVHLTNILKPDLIAGIKIKIGDYVIENSVDNQLKNLKKFVAKQKGEKHDN
ncbi:F-type H+-transporting ATPase subunit delta [Metamycoplasma subdolum]|uniref:ATP synthase subunit delta n=1 Tax=Metamycoplasma subdolum TaxID=92407 RepID=A0A3M0A6I3_9BACT|nr:F0F1 ATP synthase subunit delta [Metamycoplasma subdolum]RMA79119.1 F-type H+-transporting ATPase subunit delta [Metamycoplasma subdolum]WPB50642.1 F0F1 ATP synthase subunit delta [Metamycoplasma subdolum]